MSGLEDLERRVTAVEERLNMESRLRASADRDLADVTQALRAQQQSIQALAITQSQHTGTLAQHTETLAQHTETLAQHTETLARHTVILNQHTVILNEHTVRLDRLETSLTTMRQDHGAKLNLIVTMLDRLIDEPEGR